jgi:peptidyl-prolyl cis-trans isomerase SurA
MQQFLSRPISRTARTIAAAAMIAFGAGLAAPAPASAQGLFSPAIEVNGSVITNFELEQRMEFLRLLRAPGDIYELARTALIEDRLKAQAVSAAGIRPTEEQIAQAMGEFAQRANLGPEEFIQALENGGVSRETFRDFIVNCVIWREYVRARFLGRARPTEAEIDRAMGQGGTGGGVRVLLSEIIIPATPQTIDQVQAEAERIAQITSFDAFSEEARRYSAAPTRSEGGRMGWLPLSNLPPAIQPVVLALAPGEVTAPIPLPDAIALFQLRSIQETGAPAPRYAAIEFAAYFIPGGRSEAALAEAAELRAEVDSCDDLYGVALDQPEGTLRRESLPPADIPRDYALELAKLDEGEVSTALATNDGQSLVFLMLCGRTAALNEDASREDIAAALTNQRINALAQGFLDQLMADALIIEK